MSRHTKTINCLKDEAYDAIRTAEGFIVNDSITEKMRMLNAEFQLGKFHGVMAALKVIDVNSYIDVGEDTERRCDDILNRISLILNK